MRPVDYIVIFVFAYVASFLITSVLFIPMHWILGLIAGVVLSYMWDFWLLYEKVRLKMERDRDE